MVELVLGLPTISTEDCGLFAHLIPIGTYIGTIQGHPYMWGSSSQVPSPYDKPLSVFSLPSTEHFYDLIASTPRNPYVFCGCHLGIVQP